MIAQTRDTVMVKETSNHLIIGAVFLTNVWTSPLEKSEEILEVGALVGLISFSFGIDRAQYLSTLPCAR